jgi:hypothetical protein
VSVTRRLLFALPFALPAALLHAQQRRKSAPAKPFTEFRSGGLEIRCDSHRFQVVRAELTEELDEGVLHIPAQEGQRVLLVEFKGELGQPTWLSIPSNEFRAEYFTPQGPVSIPSLTFSTGDLPFRKPPPGAFFVANIRLEAGPVRFRALFVLPHPATSITIVLPATLMKEEPRKLS